MNSDDDVENVDLHNEEDLESDSEGSIEEEVSDRRFAKDDFAKKEKNATRIKNSKLGRSKLGRSKRDQPNVGAAKSAPSQWCYRLGIEHPNQRQT